MDFKKQLQSYWYSFSKLPIFKSPLLRGFLSQVRRFTPNKKKLIVFVVTLVLVSFSYYTGFGAGVRKAQTDTNLPAKTQSVDRSVTIQNLNLIVDKIELTNTLVVDGNPLRAPKGKQFLICYLYINNQSKEVTNIALVNFFRLMDSKGHKFAPEFYNKVTTIQPMATKTDQVGFMTEMSGAELTLEIGELDKPSKVSLQIKR